jgi:hypothetical protein
MRFLEDSVQLTEDYSEMMATNSFEAIYSEGNKGASMLISEENSSFFEDYLKRK